MIHKSNVQKSKILIVDDSPESIYILGQLLPEKFRRTVAISGEKALDLLKRMPEEDLPDLILLDVVLPGINGYEVCKMIRKQQRTANIPVIFISAFDEPFDKVNAFRSGGMDFINKPFHREETLERIYTHLKLYSMEKNLLSLNNQLNMLVEMKTVELIESQMAMIFALAKLSESRDNDTGGHLDRIRSGCRILAEKLSMYSRYRDILTGEIMNDIENASVLHDIGKVGIPDCILLKPGKLTQKEYSMMKQHVTIGADTLQQVNELYPENSFIRCGIEIARYHHEKWDGSGYPDGLSGEDIPLSAHIVSIMDMYDALRAKRPYKQAFSHQRSLHAIQRESGKSFNPVLVEAFLEIETDLLKAYLFL